MPTNYSRDEEERLLRALRDGGEARCPRCGGGMVRQDVRPPGRVPYVRGRAWFVCEGCRRSLVLDHRRLERES